MTDGNELAAELYQVALGKRPYDDALEARLGASKALEGLAALAIALAEIRQELAWSEEAGDMRAATAGKRKVELLEDLFFRDVESIQHDEAS